MTQIFLGYPPEHIKNWIIEHSKPAENPKTHIKFTDGTEDDYLIEGNMDYNVLIAAGLMSNGAGYPQWIKSPQEINIGSAVTTIGDSAFFGCNEITNMTISDNVTRIVSSAFASCSGLKSITFGNGMTIIGTEAFLNCTGLKDLTFSGKDKETVQHMTNYSWGIGSNCVIHCTDGDITLV